MATPPDDSPQAPASVAVIGGGALGTTVAWRLADRDVAVTLYEADEIAAGSSGRAAGICYTAFTSRVDVTVATRSLQAFRDRDDLAFEDRPYVWLARTDDDRNAAAIREAVPRMRAHGRDVTLLDSDALGDRFPALATDDVHVAAITHDAGCLDPTAYTRATARRARDAGAVIETGTAATLDTNPSAAGAAVAGDRYDAVVVAAGAHTGRLLAGAGLPVAVKPYRVQALVTAPTTVDVPMLYDASAGCYLRPRDGGLLVGDGTEPIEQEPDDWSRAADDWFLADAADFLSTALGETPAVEAAWAGLCTATPDGEPLVGERAPGVFTATGFQGHGFMRAPALAERLAAQVCGAPGIAPFDPRRFDGEESFAIVEGMALDASRDQR